MKALIISILALLCLSCEQTIEERKELQNELFISKAKLFIQGIVDKDEKKEVSSFVISSIDTIVDLSESMAQIAKTKPLSVKYNSELKFAREMVEIENKFGGERSVATQNAIDAAIILEDSLNREIERAKKLSDKTVGKQVTFKVDFTMSNGTTNKDMLFILNFDDDNDLPAEWNVF